MYKALLTIIFLLLLFGGLFWLNERTATKIEYDVAHRIADHLLEKDLSSREDTHIILNVDGRDVLLEGTTSSNALKDNITAETDSVLGVRRVVNNMQTPPSPSLTQTEDNSVLRDTVILDKIICAPSVCKEKLEQFSQKQKSETPTP